MRNVLNQSDLGLCCLGISVFKHSHVIWGNSVYLLNFLAVTVNFLNIRTPKKFVVITLKFELSGSTIE